MKIVIPGGSGHLGTLLARHFGAGGHKVVVVSRHETNTLPWRRVGWEDLQKEIEGADVVINLAGRNVNCRYTPVNRREIMMSRVESTRAVGEAIANVANPPHVWLQASTATIYAHRFDDDNDEHTGRIGGGEPDAPRSWDFSIEVARAWETAVDESKTPRTRKVKLRSAIVMSTGRGGPFDILRRLVRFGLGGRQGDGRQYISWIHARDFLRAIEWLIEHRYTDGVVNVAAPNPVPNEEFMRELRHACGTRIGLPASRWMLTLGAVLFRTETELVLKSRRVVPSCLLETGFRFEFPLWRAAARDLCAGSQF
ncbi:MAG TPA: TIGR01777 family oxidoreductase [Thermoanaerobaculia bacterium]